MAETYKLDTTNPHRMVTSEESSVFISGKYAFELSGTLIGEIPQTVLEDPEIMGNPGKIRQSCMTKPLQKTVVVEKKEEIPTLTASIPELHAEEPSKKKRGRPPKIQI